MIFNSFEKNFSLVSEILKLNSSFNFISKDRRNLKYSDESDNIQMENFFTAVKNSCSVISDIHHIYK